MVKMNFLDVQMLMTSGHHVDKYSVDLPRTWTQKRNKEKHR